MEITLVVRMPPLRSAVLVFSFTEHIPNDFSVLNHERLPTESLDNFSWSPTN